MKTHTLSVASLAIVALFALMIISAPTTFAQTEASSVQPTETETTTTSVEDTENTNTTETQEDPEITPTPADTTENTETKTASDTELTSQPTPTTAEGYTILTVAQQTRIDEVWMRIDTRLNTYSETTKVSVLERVQQYLTTTVAELKEFATTAKFTPEGAARHQLKIEIMEYLLTLV